MKITDLNIDCVESILDHLEFQDLLNAADSNKRISHAAKFVFIRKYNQHDIRFKVTLHSIRLKINDAILREQSFFISNGTWPFSIIYELKVALPFLRCFGCVIRKLDLYLSETVVDQYITSYINQYCVDSLTDIHMIGRISKSCFDNFKQPFTRIEKVVIDLSLHQHSQSANDWINRLFPKMRKLEVRSFKPFKDGYMGNHFPYLESLDIGSINTNLTDSEYMFWKESITTLKLNPQLKHLTVTFDMRSIDVTDIFQSVAESLNNLESLVLVVPKHICSNNLNYSIHLKSVKYLDIGYALDNNPFVRPFNFLFSFDQLETFGFQTYYLEHCYSFIEMYPTISTLCMHFNCESIARNWERLAKICPSVTKIYCINHRTSLNEMDHLDHIIAMFKSLKFLSFQLDDYGRRKHPRHLVFKLIKDHFNSDWSISIQYTVDTLYPSYYVDLKKPISNDDRIFNTKQVMTKYCTRNMLSL